MSNRISGLFTRRVVWSSGLVVAIALAVSSRAGAEDGGGLRVYNEQLRTQLDQQPPEEREVTADAGGWFDFSVFHFDDAENEEHTLRQYQLRGWGAINLKGVHKAYVRGLANWDNWNPGDNPETWHGQNDEDQRIERAWYQFDLGRMLQEQSGERPAVRPRVKVGRDFTQIGSALVLSMPLDQVETTVETDNWQWRTLLGKTIDDTPNIDTSTPVQTHQDRCIWGTELTYKGFDRHRPYIYFLSNDDHTDPRPELDDQKFDYSSRYIGGGSQGSILLPNLRYLAELVGEFGETYSRGQTREQDDIQAMAFDSQLEYLFDRKTKPKIMGEYLYASGDEDRLESSTATVGGNRHNTYDHAFNGFGFRDTGIAFAPLISNLQMEVVEASFFPLQGHKVFDRLELGSKTFLYEKANADGPISDTTATNDNGWLGWEWDVYANWRITSDLSWTIRYGFFKPGDAFDDEECRQAVFTGLTLSF